jgi:hypothetical protein
VRKCILILNILFVEGQGKKWKKKLIVIFLKNKIFKLNTIFILKFLKSFSLVPKFLYNLTGNEVLFS